MTDRRHLVQPVPLPLGVVLRALASWAAVALTLTICAALTVAAI